jgi:hypothetical protein
MARYMVSEVRQLVPWIESLNEFALQVAEKSAEQLGSALSTRDPPGWRPTTARESSGDLASQRCRSPINLWSVESLAPESSLCRSKNQQERTEEITISSVPLDCYTEHEQITFEAEPALNGQEPTESLLERPLNLREDTQDGPDSTRVDNLQAEPQATPNAHLDGEGEGKECRDQTDRREASLEEATNSTMKSAAFVATEQRDAQPLVQDAGKKGDGDVENERIDRDDEDGDGGEQQVEQVEEEEGASRAHGVYGSDDGERECPKTPPMEREPTSNEERLREDARGYRASDNTRLADGFNNAHDVPSTEEVANLQGTASPSRTSAAPMSPNGMVSTPERELECGTDAGGIILNDLVTSQANITENQAEHVGLTTRHEHDIEEAQSHYSNAVCDEDEIVVANGPQHGLRSKGIIIDPRTKDTFGTHGHIRG